MKKIFTLFLIFSSLFAYSQNSVDSTFIKNGFLTLPNLQEITNFSLNGKVSLNGPNALVRVILDMKDGRELLVFESYPLIAETNVFGFTNACEETNNFPKGTPVKLKIVVKHAQLFLKGYNYNQPLKSAVSQEGMEKKKIDLINTNLRKQGALWVAGETSISKMSYAEKEKLFQSRNLPNLQGLEYYKGGILDLRMYSNNFKAATQQTTDEQFVPWTENFSYKTLHEADDPNSPYYNTDTSECGWISSIKNQGPAGACWAFADIASLEARASLYYNQHLHLDLSEQQLISCSGQGTTQGGDLEKAMQWTALYGSVDEACFPYQAADVDSSQIGNNPKEDIFIEGALRYEPTMDYINSENGLKRMLLHNSPIALGINQWNHALLLVGYQTLDVGTTIYVPHNGDVQQGLDTITISDTSSLMGQTVWQLKNSWGADWGDHGYLDLIVDDYNDIYGSVPAGVVKSKNRTDKDIACYDKDGDGYYNWGIGARPAQCPKNTLEDGDDSDPLYGPRDDYGNLTLIGDLAGVNISGNSTVGSGAVYTLNGLPSGAVFSHWTYSSNLVSSDNTATDLSVSAPSNDGLASVTAHFTYNNNDYQITKTVATGSNQLVFVEQKTDLPPAVFAHYAVGDFDMDGDYDLVYSGGVSYDYSKLVGGYPSWNNFSCDYFDYDNGSYVRDTARIPFTGGSNTYYDVDDLNQDQKPDLAILDNEAFSEDIYYSYHRIFNSGGTLFADHVDSLDNYLSDLYSYTKVSWVDYNNDGVLDIVSGSSGLSVFNRADSKMHTFMPGGPNEITLKTFGLTDLNGDGINEAVSIPASIYDSAENDAELTAKDAYIKTYQIDTVNNTLKILDSTQILLPSTTVDAYVNPMLESADFNNDGYPDLLVAYTSSVNNTVTGGILAIYLNDHKGGFTGHLITLSDKFPNALGVQNIALGDFNNNNSVDILYTGFNNDDNAIRRVYMLTNDGEGNFTPQRINMGGVEHPSALLAADFDNDNNLDFLISGENGEFMTCGAGKTQIMLNKSTFPAMNAPDAPINLSVVDTTSGEYVFKWNKLAEGGYSYNIKIGTTPGGGEVVSCNALPNGKLTTPKMGNAGVSGLYLLKRDLPPGTYYWTVQAVDNAYRGGAFATTQQFTVGVTGVPQVNRNDPDMKLWPNPASDYVFFRIDPSCQQASLDILNIQGQIVQSQNLKENNRVPVHNLKEGLYVCVIDTGEKIMTQKLLIQR